jgi:adenylosuccinate lyase
LVVYPKVIEKNLRAELPFMATEDLLMEAVNRGGDRQDLHERIRQHSQAAAAVVKNEGGENDLWERLSNDPAFSGIDMNAALEPSSFIGRSPEQVDEFLAEQIDPVRHRYEDVLYATNAEVRV